MDERLRFVARLLEGEKMAVLCREFDISRKTGYKLFARYKDCGVEGLSDRSRRPYRHANRLPFQIETLIVQLKKEHPSWGAPKIREKIRRRHKEIQLPAISTVHAVLDRHGLVTRGRRNARYHAEGTGLSTPTLSELLRTFRTRAGLTQAALAEMAGLSEQAISVLERGTPLSLLLCYTFWFILTNCCTQDIQSTNAFFQRICGLLSPRTHKKADRRRAH